MIMEGHGFLQFLLLLIAFTCIRTSWCMFGLASADLNVECIESERNALLAFKEGFDHNPTSSHFASWGAKDNCCKWEGVECNQTTGHVISLSVGGDPSRRLQGQLNASLCQLPYMRNLDLSMNDFLAMQIPEFIGSLTNLESLNLSNAHFRGTIPSHFGNLSRIQHLDLSGNDFSLRSNNLNWLRGLSLLKHLNLGDVDLMNVVDWLETVNMLPSLVELHLSGCQLKSLPQSLPLVNFTSLKILDLSFNNFSSSIPNWLFDIKHSLVYLKIQRSHLQGLIPDSLLENMTSLAVLDLSENLLKGGLPLSLKMTHSSLRELRLYGNRLSGSLPKTLARLSNLVVLDVSSNLLKGMVTESMLKLSSLKVLNLSFNSFRLNVTSTWIPTFQLEIIRLQSCKLGPHFPLWLQTQKSLLFVDISNAAISDTVPEWFWNISSLVTNVDLSGNYLRGEVPNLSLKLSLSTLDLSFNYFSGPLPHFSPNMRFLLLSRNSFFGTISNLCEVISVKNNLTLLDLSWNSLSGQVPNCWIGGQNLVSLDLSGNKFSGEIPSSIGELVHLNWLILVINNFSGELPFSLKNCTSLNLIMLGRNKLSGNIPTWIGKSLKNLKVLSLHSNKFDGSIPEQLCQLKYLKWLNLHSNYLSGEIRPCIKNFLTMAEVEVAPSYIYYPDANIRDVLEQMKRGRFFLPVMGSNNFTALNLSRNNLTGEIPEEITSLIGLTVLDLSSNHLTGTIPNTIGAMRALEILDLSKNHLSCNIPLNMLGLSYLHTLNLSYNNFSGKIPQGAHFSTFQNNSYVGNRFLCGHPLTKECSRNNESYEEPYCRAMESGGGEKESMEEEHDEFERSFHISMGLGFVVGLWGLWGTLLLNHSWRYAYFKFFSTMNDKIYVLVIITLTRLRRNLASDPSSP